MTRRRRPSGLGEPLFGEDWWADDQQLFQDSVTRRAAPARRPRRTATIRKRETTAAAGYEQDMLPLSEEPPGAAGEPLRGDGAGSLGPVAAGPVRGDRGSGQLLLGFGSPGGSEDRQPGPGPGGRRPAGGGLSGQGGPAGRGPAPGRADRPDREHPPAAGTGSRPGRGEPAGERPLEPPGRALQAGSAGQLAPRFRPAGQQDLAPSGAVARARANLAALTTVQAIRRESRPATGDEQRTLAQWSGWGAVPEAFDPGRA